MLDLLLRIVSTFATLIIGVAAAVLAYQQFRISKAKLRFDLYERRLALFKLAREFATAMVDKTEMKQMVTLQFAWDFDRDTSERYFLFSPDIADYFDTLYKKAYELGQLQQSIADAKISPNERERIYMEEFTKLRIWFSSQSGNMYKLFRKDLSIKTLR